MRPHQSGAECSDASSPAQLIEAWCADRSDMAWRMDLILSRKAKTAEFKYVRRAERWLNLQAPKESKASA